MKGKCYANNPQTITDLKAEIHAMISELWHETIVDLLKNWVHRIGYYQVSHGGHLTESVFHKINVIFQAFK